MTKFLNKKAITHPLYDGAVVLPMFVGTYGEVNVSEKKYFKRIVIQATPQEEASSLIPLQGLL